MYITGLCLLGYSSYSMPAKVPQRCSQQSFPHGTTPPQLPGNYGKTITKRYISISKHHVNAWFMYVWVNISRVQVRAEPLFLPWEIPLLLWPATALSCFPLLALFRSFCHSILLFAQPSAFWNLRLLFQLQSCQVRVAASRMLSRREPSNCVSSSLIAIPHSRSIAPKRSTAT